MDAGATCAKCGSERAHLKCCQRNPKPNAEERIRQELKDQHWQCCEYERHADIAVPCASFHKSPIAQDRTGQGADQPADQNARPTRSIP